MKTSFTADCGERDVGIGGYIIDRTKWAAEVRRLSEINNIKATWSIIRQWIIIAIVVGLALWTKHWAVWVIAAIVCATRQHALAVIMHDATHYRLFTNRWVNEIISDLFCAFPVGLSTQLYRKQHLEHHRYTNTDKDPYWTQMMAQEDWNWPKLHIESFKLFFKDIIGLNAHKMFAVISQWSPWPRVLKLDKGDNVLTPVEQIRWVAFVVVMLVVLYFTHGWLPFLLLWVLPSITILGAFFRMRGIAEHLVLESEHELNSTRHVDATLLERWSIAPLNINCHIAHHLFPSVPQYNLPELQRILMKDETFREHAHLVKNYLSLRNGVLAEISLPSKTSAVIS